MIISSFRRLVAPHDPKAVEDALSEGRRLHLAAADGAVVSEAIRADFLDRLITPENLAAGRVIATRGGRALPLDAVMTQPVFPAPRQISGAGLRTLVERGGSLIVNRVDELAPEIDFLCAAVERHFGLAAHVNAYASFAGHGALAAHWDDHHILVVQLRGQKRWEFFGNPHLSPVRGAGLTNPGVAPDSEPEAEIVMRPGDLLYVPWGEVHRARADGGPSVHLTIGMAPSTGAHVLAWLARERQAAEAALREEVVRPGCARVDAQRRDRLGQALARLSGEIDLKAFFADMDARRPLVSAPTVVGAADLRPDTQVVPLTRRILAASDAGGLQAGGRTFELGEAVWRAFDLIQRGDGVTLAELTEALPGVDVAHAVRELLAQGLAYALLP